MKRRFIVVCLAALLLGLGMVAVFYAELPARIPIHWNGSGQVDRWGERHLVLLPSAFVLGLAALWLALPKLSPRRFAVESFEDTWWFSGMAVVCLLAYLQCVHLWAAREPGFAVDRAIVGGLGLFFVLTGNVMGKLRRNFWLGVRTPWTLANERVWYATHRLAGKTMVVGGLLSLAVVLAGLPSPAAVALLVGAALVPVAFSLVYYKRLERAGTLEA